MKRSLILLVLGFSTITAMAANRAELTCTPQEKDDWIKSVRIHVPSRKVWLQLQGEDLPHELPLLHVGPEQFGAPTYHFNWTVEGTPEPVVNVFKVFRTMDQWRMINAGMETRSGILVIRALGSSQVMRCN